MPEEKDRPRRMWEIADFADAYSTRLATPLQVAKSIVARLEEVERSQPGLCLLISHDKLDLMHQAQSSTLRSGLPVHLQPSKQSQLVLYSINILVKCKNLGQAERNFHHND